MEETGEHAAAVGLLWIPLGAGGRGFIRFNGRVYERFVARRERRSPCDLYHTALVIRLPDTEYIIENAWPSPDGRIEERGVVVEGPVFHSKLARFRPFRYEVRCWRDGIIADADEAVGGVQWLSSDQGRAHELLSLVGDVPVNAWGRDKEGLGEMWNSNSVIGWLLQRGGLLSDGVRPPAGGRAPGWEAGVALARQ